jgi:hypothetical protein
VTPATWTTPEQLIAQLRARWDRGQYLRAHARAEPWHEVTLPVKGPTPDDVLHDPAAVHTWARRLHDASRTRGHERFSIEYRTVRNRVLGNNEVPARIRIPSLQQLAALVGAADDLSRFDRLLGTTRRRLPEATPWVAAHPIAALATDHVWNRILDTVSWIVEHDTSSSDLRHLDVSGVDTKFVEQHRKVLAGLLDQVLAPDRLDPSTTDFARRYGFRPRPRYVRFRLLTPVPGFPSQLSELEVRTSELAQIELPITTVFVIENKASYLAFPTLPDAIAIFGEGFGVTTLETVPWLTRRDLIYWGDIDTHGFAILHRLRERVPTTRSMLMDRDTLLAHRSQVVTEPNPTNAPLPLLTPHEAELYRDLIEDRYGTAIRLEQERVRFSLVRRALTPWAPASELDRRERQLPTRTGLQRAGPEDQHMSWGDASGDSKGTRRFL